jgi:hypothetical protein
MKQYKIQNRSQKNSQSCVLLTGGPWPWDGQQRRYFIANYLRNDEIFIACNFLAY